MELRAQHDDQHGGDDESPGECQGGACGTSSTSSVAEHGDTEA